MTLEVVADDRDCLPVAAAHVKRVAAEATDDLDRHALTRALDEEPVVALEGVDDDPLEPGVGDEQPGAVYALVVDNEVVAEDFAPLFRVSGQAMRIRLEELRLLRREEVPMLST